MRVQREAKTFATYLAASVVALGADVSSYAGFLALGIPPALAAAFSYTIGILVHFALSQVFIIVPSGVSGTPPRQLLVFAFTGLAGIAVTTGAVYVVHDLIGLHPGTAKATAVGASFFAVYLLRRKLVFRLLP